MPIASFLKDIGRPTVRFSRELPVWSQAGLGAVSQALGQGRGPVAVFLPAYGDTGAAKLRIYGIAPALRARGWRVHVLPWRLTLVQRRRILAAIDPDLVVMQGARHALNRPALYPGYRIVYDMDDADFHLPHLAGPVAEAMGQVAAVIAGSAYIADWCQRAGAGAVHVVWTGSPVSRHPRVVHSDRPPVVAWAQTRPATYLREAALVRGVMAQVATHQPGVRLRLYDWQKGDDPGFGDSFAAPGVQVEWVKRASYADYLASMGDVAIGLAPLCPETPFSRGKGFGKVLAYLDRGVPVVGSDAGEHGGFFTDRAGVITNNTDAWVAEIAKLLRDASARQIMADKAAVDFRLRLSTEAVSVRVDRILRNVIEVAGNGS